MGMAIVEQDPKPACRFGNTTVAQPLKCPCNACVVVRELEAERDQFSVDAGRYRYLRSTAILQHRNGPGLYWYLSRGGRGATVEERLDNSIDSNLKAKGHDH
jgi:hypothetical protein